MTGREFLFTHECHHNIFQTELPKNSKVKNIKDDFLLMKLLNAFEFKIKEYDFKM